MIAPSASARENPLLVPNPDPAISSAEIDASCRWPVLLLFISATGWLLCGTLLGLMASIKLHAPGFLAGSEWLTLGRIRPAAWNALLYGFASQAGIGLLLWLFCRLGRVRLFFPVPIVISSFFWNLGVTLGLLGILGGGSTGFEWLEMPGYASAILFSAYAVIGLCALVTFHFRRERFLYVSQWYLLAALFWFPWIYSAANLLLIFDPVRGVLQAVVNAWFTSNLLGLWLTPLALGASFYFIPRLVGRPLYSNSLAALGFWVLAFASNWTGLTPLIGGPVPRWMTSTSTAACLILTLPLIVTALNWRLTLMQNCPAVKGHTVLHFILAGAFSYVLGTIGSICLGWPAIAARTQFTYVPVALKYLALYGSLGMTFFGSIYYILPRLVQVEWPKANLIRVHFVMSLAGTALLFGALVIGGLIQGKRMNDPSVLFILVAKGTAPWVGMGTLGFLLLLGGQIAFLMNLAPLLRQFCARNCAWICDYCCPSNAENTGGKS